MKCLRLSLISQRDLLNIVRPSGLFAPDTILDAIEEQDKKRTTDLTYRGFLSKCFGSTFTLFEKCSA